MENTRNSVPTQEKSLCQEPILLIIVTASWHMEDLGCISHCADHLILTVNLVGSYYLHFTDKITRLVACPRSHS